MRLSGRTALAYAGAISAASGLALVWIRLFCAPPDEFSAVRHPAEAWILLAHRWIAPLAMVAVGWAIGDHASIQLARGGPSKSTGAPLLVLLGAVILSGTALQTLDLGDARAIIVWSHVSLNFGATIAIAAHVRATRRLRA